MLGGVLSKSVTPGSWRARALVPAALVLAALPALAQEPIWIEQLGTARWDGTIACAPDGSGGVFAGGSTYGNLAAPVTGYIDAWLGRYDDAGHLMWIRQFGASGIAFTWGLASDASGGVYACGYTGGDLGGPSAGLEDVWLARFDGAGGQLWMRQFGTSKEDYARAATPDGTGGVYVTGDTHGPLGGPSLGTKDAWIARFDSSGNQLWVRQLGTSSGDISQAAAPDGMHGVYIGGYTSGALAGAHVGNYDAFLARYSGSGVPLWARQLGKPGQDEVLTAAPDGAGGVFAAGSTAGDLGGTSAGSFDAWLAHFDGQGHRLWIRQLGTSTDDMAWTAAPDGAGGLFLSGQTGGLLGAQGFGGRDIWVAHFDDTGAETWTWQLGTVFEDNVSASVVGRGGRLFLGGTTRGSLGGPSAGEYDAWVGRFDTSCTPGTSYCVTSLTSIPGCQAAIHGAGFPHLDDPDGYRISSGNVPGGALGICLFGDSGPASTPIGTLGGQICVQSPAFRCQPESGGGTPGVCDGELTFTLQDLIAVSPIVVTGATIHAQIWARDGANPDGFLLSDGLRFTVCP